MAAVPPETTERRGQVDGEAVRFAGRCRIGSPFISARKRAIVSLPTPTSTVASNSRMRRSEAPLLPQLHDAVLNQRELGVRGPATAA